MFLRSNTYAVRPSLCVGIPTQINSLNQGHCEGRPSLGLGTRMKSGQFAFSYPEPFFRAVRRGALAKSISELASDWLVLTPDIVFLPCFCGIRLWIWPEPLVAPRVRRALGTRMDSSRILLGLLASRLFPVSK